MRGENYFISIQNFVLVYKTEESSEEETLPPYKSKSTSPEKASPTHSAPHGAPQRRDAPSTSTVSRQSTGWQHADDDG